MSNIFTMLCYTFLVLSPYAYITMENRENLTCLFRVECNSIAFFSIVKGTCMRGLEKLTE